MSGVSLVAVGTMRALGADVVHLSVGAAGHAQPWYCSASRKGPPPLSAYAVGASPAEVTAKVLDAVRAWPPRESPDATEVTPGPAGPTPVEEEVGAAAKIPASPAGGEAL